MGLLGRNLQVDPFCDLPSRMLGKIDELDSRSFPGVTHPHKPATGFAAAVPAVFEPHTGKALGCERHGGLDRKAVFGQISNDANVVCSKIHVEQRGSQFSSDATATASNRSGIGGAYAIIRGG
jgi:hypothetical protein